MPGGDILRLGIAGPQHRKAPEETERNANRSQRFHAGLQKKGNAGKGRGSTETTVMNVNCKPQTVSRWKNLLAVYYLIARGLLQQSMTVAVGLLLVEAIL
jgi:hypothetical protein